MNGAETLRAAADRVRHDSDGWGSALADWFDGILSPVSRRKTTASDDEVRHALTIARAINGEHAS